MHCDQSYKHSAIIIFDSRSDYKVVYLESSNLRLLSAYKICHRS